MGTRALFFFGRCPLADDGDHGINKLILTVYLQSNTYMGTEENSGNGKW